MNQPQSGVSNGLRDPARRRRDHCPYLDHVSPVRVTSRTEADLIRQTMVSSLLDLASNNLSSTSRDRLI